MAVKIGCVSYINSRPLVWGLDHEPSVQLQYLVPANLLDSLLNNHCDIALLPIIDYQRDERLVVVPASCIGADGPVYTVRLYSQTPIDRIRTLHLDSESHTSVALCRIILKHLYQCEPEIVINPSQADAVLLIGDKVVSHAPANPLCELDLADIWKKWLGLPFVFATWMCIHPNQVGQSPSLLKKALERGLQNIDSIAHADAPGRRWPVDLAKRYLSHMLRFNIDLSPNSPQRQSIELFHRMAFEMGFIPHCRPLAIHPVR